MSNRAGRPRTALTALTVLLAAAAVSGCGEDSAGGADSDGRKFSVSYKIRTDADRTLSIKLTGSFTAREEKAEAEAGETEVHVKTEGEAKVTNVSDGRNTDDFKHGVELFLPTASCPGWVEGSDGKVGPYCSYDLFKVDIDDLDVGDDTTVNIDTDEMVAEVPTDRGPTLVKDIMGSTGVLLSADRVFWNQDLEKYNPTCTLPGEDGGKWVTYFTEDKSVNACSTEAK